MHGYGKKSGGMRGRGVVTAKGERPQYRAAPPFKHRWTAVGKEEHSKPIEMSAWVKTAYGWAVRSAAVAKRCFPIAAKRMVPSPQPKHRNLSSC
jgi:hypothetical protein